MNLNLKYCFQDFSWVFSYLIGIMTICFDRIVTMSETVIGKET